MQAVILDDAEVRHQAFLDKDGSKYTHIEHCYNIAQFVHFVLTFPGTIDFVSLDHDLGDHDNPTGQPLYGLLHGTGMDAARLLAVLPEQLRPRSVNVHSQNAIGQKAMVELLKSSGYHDVTDFFLME